MNAKLWLLLPFLGFQAAHAQVDEKAIRSFLFSGPCTAQGNWTREALNTNQKVRNLVLQLQTAPECKGLADAVQGIMAKSDQNLQQIQSEYGDNSPDSGAARKGLAIIDTIQSVAAESGINYTPMIRTAIGNNIDSARASLRSNPVESLMSGQGQNRNQAINPSRNWRRSVNLGLSYAEQLIDNLPKIQTCSVGANTEAQYFAAITHMIASYVSSGEDGMATQFSKVVQKLANYARESKFAASIRTLNDADFRTSLQCIMEVTSETYCSAKDALMLFDKVMGNHKVSEDKLKQLKLEEKQQAVDKAKSPLGGYYVLSQHVPNVTGWLLKVQIGVDPNLTTEAQFQKDVIDRTLSFFKSMKDLQALFRSNKLLIDELPELKQKQNAIIELVLKLSGAMIGGGPMGDSGSFFTQTVGQDMDIPFRLIGMEETPGRVQGNDGQGLNQTPSEWLKGNYARLPMFQDPNALLETINQALLKMIQKAEAAAIIFYNKFFIVDKAGIVNDSFAGMNFSVRESLTAIYYYLEQLSNRITHYNKDLTLIPSIQDTMQRIRVVLKRFERIKELGAELTKSGPITPAIQEQVNDLNIDLIEEVYKQFQVLLARTGWLQNRMVTFVQYDYIMMVRNNESLEPYYRDLFRSLGVHAISQMVEIAGKSPGAMMEDLAMAQNTNKDNIRALETLLSDRLTQEIAKLRLIANNNKVNGMKLIKDNMVRRYQDGYQTNVTESQGGFLNKTLRTLRGVGHFTLETLFPFFSSSNERYIPRQGFLDEASHFVNWVFGSDDPVLSTDDEHGSAKKTYAQLCVQALAFDNLRPYWFLCRGSKLESPYQVPENDAKLKERFNKYLSVDFAQKAWDGLNPKTDPNQRDYRTNKTNRICAFRDFNRRNLVMMLTRQAEETYNQEVDLKDIMLEDFRRIRTELKDKQKLDTGTGAGSGASSGSGPAAETMPGDNGSREEGSGDNGQPVPQQNQQTQRPNAGSSATLPPVQPNQPSSRVHRR